jgi:phage tail sheath protein FI
VAPANLPVRDTLNLTPLLEPTSYVNLYDGNVNLIRRDAGEFMLWGAGTLSAIPELQPLNVRRLLILLRRLVLREGQTYVFAPHSPAFRRRVARQLERQLAGLFARGAFAGSDPRQAYRVVVEETLNTPASVEQGRFIVELRIAPAQPLAFITVRLIQTSTETFRVQEGASLA